MLTSNYPLFGHADVVMSMRWCSYTYQYADVCMMRSGRRAGAGEAPAHSVFLGLLDLFGLVFFASSLGRWSGASLSSNCT